MQDFEYHVPDTLPEVFQVLEQYGEGARVIAGGTALVLQMKQRLLLADHLVALRRVPGLDRIWVDDEGLHLGALCTHRRVETNPLVLEYAPMLAGAYRRVATPRIRNMATVGGGLVNGDPSQDPPPALLVLGARLKAASANGERIIDLDDFFLGYYETALAPGEVVTEVIVPPIVPGTCCAYLKFLPRTADDYATVSAAVAVRVDHGICQQARIALGSVGPTPIRARQAEAEVMGKELSATILRRAGEAATSEVDPLDDFRGSAKYKREMVAVFVRRALESAIIIPPSPVFGRRGPGG